MKKIILFTSLFLSINLFSNELQWVDEQIKAIKPPRIGITHNKINATKSPFIFLTNKKKDEVIQKTLTSSVKTTRITTNTTRKVVQKRSPKGFRLDAIINHSALINGKWYKRNAKVGKYRLSLVNISNVVLTYKNKEVLLSMLTKNKKLKFKRN